MTTLANFNKLFQRSHFTVTELGALAGCAHTTIVRWCEGQRPNTFKASSACLALLFINRRLGSDLKPSDIEGWERVPDEVMGTVCPIPVPKPVRPSEADILDNPQFRLRMKATFAEWREDHRLGRFD